MAEKKQDSEFQELKSDIRAGNIGRLYFFHGEETFLLQHYLEQVKKQLLDELTETFNFHKLTVETFDVQVFADTVENLPMMAERTMVQVDEVDLFKLPENERTAVIEILSDIPDYCTVVFTYITVPWRPDKRLTKLWDTVNTYGTIVDFPRQEHKDLIAWITRHFAARGKKIPTDLCGYLIDITDGTMTSLAGEIGKICAYSGADVIRKSDIDAVTEPVLDAVIYQMTDHLGRGQYGAALQSLQKLLKMQEEPLGLLGAIGSHFRRINAAKTLIDSGKGSEELRKLYSMGDYPARKTMEAARKFRPEFCRKALELVLETDRWIKTSLDTPERLMEMLILQLAQEARNG